MASRAILGDKSYILQVKFSFGLCCPITIIHNEICSDCLWLNHIAQHFCVFSKFIFNIYFFHIWKFLQPKHKLHSMFCYFICYILSALSRTILSDKNFSYKYNFILVYFGLSHLSKIRCYDCLWLNQIAQQIHVFKFMHSIHFSQSKYVKIICLICRLCDM